MKTFKELEQKRWFTSDLHFGDDRLSIFQRDFIAKTSDDVDALIIKNFNDRVGKNDLTYFLGDISPNKDKLHLIDKLNGEKILIKGNYDENIDNDELLKYFSEVHNDLEITINGEPVWLNHYPTNCKENMFNITGHIHGLWRVQRNMLNVGVDAWFFCPVSEEKVIFQINGIRKHYDENVFAGELNSNLKNN